MISKKGIYYLWLTLLIVTVVISCSNYFGRKNITYIQNVNGVNCVSVDDFNKMLESKSLGYFSYDVAQDLLAAYKINIPAKSDETTEKVGYSNYTYIGYTTEKSNEKVYLGGVSKLIDDKKLTDTEVLNAVNANIKVYTTGPLFYLGMAALLLGTTILINRYLNKQNKLNKNHGSNQENQGAQKNTNLQGGATSTLTFEVLTNADTGVKLVDVKGHDEVKEDIQFIIKFLKNADKYSRLGAKPPKGIMLFGPPGVGKTMLVKAIASEAGIPVIATCGSDFVNKYVGVGADAVRNLFNQARKYPKCIIYIDEIDALGRKRDDSNEERAVTLNALLVEMNGFKDSKGILVMASTNRLDMLDEALLRPGRFDKHISVNLPDLQGRLEILKLYAKDKEIDASVDLNRLARLTRGFSGADLDNLLNEAALLAASRDKNEIDMVDIDDAHYKVTTKGDKKRNHDRSEIDTAITAWHEAGHAIVSKLVAKQNVNKVTIIPSTSNAGGITFMENSNQWYYSKEDLENKVKTFYAGRAAEFILLGDERKVTTGASNDIEQATNCLKNMHSEYGMSGKYGLIKLSSIRGLDTTKLVDELSELSLKLYNDTVDFLQKNYCLLEDMANILIERETLVEDELNEMFDKYSSKLTIKLSHDSGKLNDFKV